MIFLKRIKLKKGMLLASETLKMVLSVISIGLLVFLLYSLYYSTTDKQDQKAAEATMEKAKEVFLEVDRNSSFKGRLDGITPSGWSFFSFVNGQKKPNQCFGANCFCICDDKLLGNTFNSQLKECSGDGKCIIINDLIKFEEIKIEKGGRTSISIIKTDLGIEVKEI
jgi:hypothetical protein